MSGVMGSGELMNVPVSVCHQVSMICSSSRPICLRYQIQASGLMGSPTVPSSRRLFKLHLSDHCAPAFMNILMAVGAVYKTDTLCSSMICHHLEKSGKSGDPSYITLVTPSISGAYTM